MRIGGDGLVMATLVRLPGRWLGINPYELRVWVVRWFDAQATGLGASAGKDAFVEVFAVARFERLARDDTKGAIAVRLPFGT